MRTFLSWRGKTGGAQEKGVIWPFISAQIRDNLSSGDRHALIYKDPGRKAAEEIMRGYAEFGKGRMVAVWKKRTWGTERKIKKKLERGRPSNRQPEKYRDHRKGFGGVILNKTEGGGCDKTVQNNDTHWGRAGGGAKRHDGRPGVWTQARGDKGWGCCIKELGF